MGWQGQFECAAMHAPNPSAHASNLSAAPAARLPKVRRYDLTLRWEWRAPDGYRRRVITANSSERRFRQPPRVQRGPAGARGGPPHRRSWLQACARCTACARARERGAGGPAGLPPGRAGALPHASGSPAPPAIAVMPGPTLTCEVGDRLVIRVRNNLPEPTTIHW